MAKFGVMFGEELADKVEEPLEYGDSRSERIRNLTELGLILERHLKRQGINPDRPAEVNEVVFTAIREYMDMEEEVRT